jgi:hypothetical protein
MKKTHSPTRRSFHSGRRQGRSWWPNRSASRLVTEVDGYPRPLHLTGSHSAPSSPAIRLAEAETFSLLTGPGHDVIALGDWNAIPATGPDPALDGVSRVEARRKLDRRAAQAIEDAGFIDAGARAGNRVPTAGFAGPDRLAYACDRIYTTLPPEAVLGYRVIGGDEPATGHGDAAAGLAAAGVRGPVGSSSGGRGFRLEPAGPARRARRPSLTFARRVQAIFRAGVRNSAKASIRKEARCYFRLRESPPRARQA